MNKVNENTVRYRWIDGLGSRLQVNVVTYGM